MWSLVSRILRTRNSSAIGSPVSLAVHESGNGPEATCGSFKLMSAYE